MVTAVAREETASSVWQ